jgi:hypothetical protein
MVTGLGDLMLDMIPSVDVRCPDGIIETLEGLRFRMFSVLNVRSRSYRNQGFSGTHPEL